MNAQVLEQQNAVDNLTVLGRTELTFELRVLIQKKLEQGVSCAQIARDLCCNKSCISREVRRLPEGQYDARQAQYLRDENVVRRGRKPKISNDESIQKIIIDQLQLGWTPEQIAATRLSGKVTCQTIYNWIHKAGLKSLLVRKGKNPRSEEYRGKLPIPDENTIDKRPPIINEREVFGHWEIDTVNPARGKGKSCILTIVERVSRFYVCFKMPDRTSASVLDAVTKFVNMFGPDIVKSITSDRGKEFACFKEIEELGPKFYFCNPYHPQERGTNENTNGLLRRFYPKGESFEQVTQEELDRVVNAINNFPKKIHGFKTTQDVFKSCMILKKLFKKDIELVANVG